MWAYNNANEALIDVLRLSRGMTYKNSISGLNLGGGKAVIIGDARTMKTEAMMRRFGKFVNSLGGKYITAEDVGISPADMVFVNMETDNVVGLPSKSGDPSPVTAYGTYVGMKAAAKVAYGSDNLEGKRILIQGVGSVGSHLVDHLVKENAVVFIADIFDASLAKITKKHPGVQIVPNDQVYDFDMDIYAPCALGATLNDDTLSKLKCKVVAGAANNQLANENIHGQVLLDKKIIYAPDYAINAGGVMNCYAEVKGLSSSWAMNKAEDIYNTVFNIISRSNNEGIPAHLIANKMAEERIEAIGKVKLPM
jgi:leucine dehydrogenase